MEAIVAPFSFSIITVLFILIWHYYADFILQTNWQAMNKSKNFEALISHVTVYALAWVIPLWIVKGLIPTLAFTFLTFGCHLITDYVTSRVNSYILEKESEDPMRWHNFFGSVGFDQVLHYIQLFFTWKLIFG